MRVRDNLFKGEFEKLSALSPLARQPNDCRIALKPHQLSAIQAMRNLERGVGLPFKTRVGVYCDKVGAGKTHSILSHLCTHKDAPETPLSMPVAFGSMVSYELQEDDYEIIHTNVIVVPHSIILQWESASTMYNNLRSLIVYKKAHIPDCIERYVNYDVIVVSSTFYKYIHMQCIGYKIQRLIFDEADTIAITKCEGIKSSFYWFVTSSVKNLVFPNGLYLPTTNLPLNTGRVEGVRGNEFVRTTFQHIHRFPYLDKLFIKNEDKFVDESFQLPTPSVISYVCKTPSYITLISQFMSDKMMESLHAGDKDTAIQHLRDTGIEVTNEETIISTVQKSFHIKIQNVQKTIEYVQDLNIPESQRERRLRQLEQEIQGLRSRQELLNEKMSNVKGENCPVCYDTIEHPCSMLMCCNNMFCLECITKVTCTSTNAASKCPMCRQDITTESLRVIHQGSNQPIKPTEKLSKIEQLRKILKENPNGKFLIFSSYDNTFHKIKEAFKDEDFSMDKPVGSVQNLRKKILDYQHGKLNILMLNTQLLASGLNLECTTHVIFFHKMSHMTENQVIGRAQRAGRKEALTIVHLLHIDEKQTVSNT